MQPDPLLGAPTDLLLDARRHGRRRRLRILRQVHRRVVRRQVAAVLAPFDEGRQHHAAVAQGELRRAERRVGTTAEERDPGAADVDVLVDEQGDAAAGAQRAEERPRGTGRAAGDGLGAEAAAQADDEAVEGRIVELPRDHGER
jgi:hypothetical protein